MVLNTRADANKVLGAKVADALSAVRVYITEARIEAALKRGEHHQHNAIRGALKHYRYTRRALRAVRREHYRRDNARRYNYQQYGEPGI